MLLIPIHINIRYVDKYDNEYMMIIWLAKTMIKKMFKKEVIDGELDTKGKSSLEWVRGGSTMANILFVQEERMRMIGVKSQYIKLWCWW